MMLHMCWWINALFAVHWDYKSHTGTTMSFGKGSVLSLSTKQKSNTSSSMETELVRVNDTMSLVLWVCSFLQAQGPEVINNVIFQDDQSYW